LYRVVEHITEMMRKDIDDNRNIGIHGADFILAHPSGRPDGSGVRILTHCNTGSLATCGYGTALGVIRRLAELGRLGKYLFLLAQNDQT
jgi:methylthioribose-1-phosphate isomerase